MKGNAMGPQQTYPDQGSLLLRQIGWILSAGWRLIRGADRPTYITVPVGRGQRAVLVVPPTAAPPHRR